MKLEVGKKYVLNNGNIEECTKMYGEDPLGVDHLGFGPFVVGGVRYHQDGRFANCKRDDELSVKHEYVPQPTLWRDMTDAEKGALLLAQHEGRTIQYWDGCFFDIKWGAVFYDGDAYRVKPEPKVVTVPLMADFKQIGTIKLIDGKPDPASIKMELS